MLQQGHQLAGDGGVEAVDQGQEVFSVQLAHQIGRHVGVHGGDQVGGPGGRQILQQLRPQLGAHLVEDARRRERIELGQQVGGGVGAQLLKDVGGVVGVGLRQGFPFGGVGVEVLLHRLRLYARLVPQALGQFPRPPQPYLHR